MKLLSRLIIILTLFLTLGLPLAHAIDEDPRLTEIQKQIDEYKAKIAASQSEAKTLSSALALLTNKKYLTQKQIEATQFQIELLERNIKDLSGKIGFLEGNLDKMTAIFIKTVQSTYQSRTIPDLELIFDSKEVGSIVARVELLSAMRKARQDILVQTTQAKLAYDKEKTTKEQKQLEVQKLKDKYIKQKQDLVDQEAAKQQLLKQTKNNEATYQRLLSEAESQLATFRGFSQSKGGGLLPPQNSPDGWFFSQRDERWGNICIGLSCGTKNEGTIHDVGCLIADLAMIKKKFGENVTPASIAVTSSYFFSTTAYMLQPWPAPSGKRYERLSYSQSTLDSELSKGNPVIAHLRVNTRDGHFIVIKSGQNGDYLIHDPWEGYDKKFTQFYSLSQISSINVLR